MANVWQNSMACHPRAMYHIAGSCHLVNSLSWFQSYATLQGAVTWRNQCHDRATLQGVIIPSVILKIVFRHILFYFLKMQFGLWRVVAFISSPIHSFYYHFCVYVGGATQRDLSETWYIVVMSNNRFWKQKKILCGIWACSQTCYCHTQLCCSGT